MIEEEQISFARLLRVFRLEAELTQDELAEKARISSGAISMLELGKRGARQAPHGSTVKLLVAALGLTEEQRGRFEQAAKRLPCKPRRRLPVERAKSLRKNNLPSSFTSFLGREEECAALRRLHTSGTRLLTLTGPGGIGKTRLALETARTLRDDFPDGVWFVELASLADPTSLNSKAAATLGIHHGGGDSWIDELSEKHLLVVLDNCEHIISAAATLARHLLIRCPSIRILATSREALHIPGEHIIRLKPLDIGRTCVQMFLDRARKSAPDFAIEDEQTLLTICTRLDGIPLAIELAAARMHTMNVKTLADSLDKLVVVGTHASPQPRRTLRTVFDWSYDLLSEAERYLFRRLSLFAGGWTSEAAESVCTGSPFPIEDVPALIASLADKSLVVVDTRSYERYDLLETTRLYALDRLKEHGEYASTAHAHAAYYAQLIRQANTTYGKPSLPAWLDPLEPELDNVRAALHWSLVEKHDTTLGACIAAAYYEVLEALSSAPEGLYWCELALAALDPYVPPHLEAPLRLALCKGYSNSGSVTRAIVAATSAARLHRTIEQGWTPRNFSLRSALAYALGFLAFNLTIQGGRDEAKHAASEAVRIAREEKETYVQAFALTVRSTTIDANDVTTRRALIAEAKELSRSFPGSLIFGLALLEGCSAEFAAGDFDRAREYAHEAAGYYKRHGLGEDIALLALSLSAVSSFAADRFDEAEVEAHTALSQANQASPGFLTPALQVVASIAARRGRPEIAAQLMDGVQRFSSDVRKPSWRPALDLHERTLKQLRTTHNAEQLSAWTAQSREWSFKEYAAAALRSRSYASELFE